MQRESERYSHVYDNLPIDGTIGELVLRSQESEAFIRPSDEKRDTLDSLVTLALFVPSWEENERPKVPTLHTEFPKWQYYFEIGNLPPFTGLFADALRLGEKDGKARSLLHLDAAERSGFTLEMVVKDGHYFVREKGNPALSWDPSRYG